MRRPGADLRRRLPSVDEVLRDGAVRALQERYGREALLRHLRELLDEARGRAAAGDEAAIDQLLPGLAGLLAARLAAQTAPSLVTVVNATGVVIHTNLGRAPLPARAAARVAEVASAYSNLELDLASGERGDREAHSESRLRRLLGAEGTLVVNNNAAAVLLAVNTFAQGKEVLVSRGELVEIGGSFRIPDVLRKGGARLREVGTTNRTRLSDYRSALGSRTGLVLKVHPSNFRIVGFTQSVEREELVSLAHEAGLPLVEDLGSGLLAPLPEVMSAEPSVERVLATGVDVVTFSGDKLLGGPQAGLAAGRSRAIDGMRRNALYRALRVDKMTVAALDAVLAEYEAGRARETVPVLRMLWQSADEVRARAEALAAALRARSPGVDVAVAVVPGASAVGGGAAPAVDVPTALLTIGHPHREAGELAAALRAQTPPVVVRVADGRLLIDLRTVRPEEEGILRDALARVIARA